MSKNTDRVLGDFHKPSNPSKHPADSIGNQQIWLDGPQIGAIEYIPTKTGLELRVQTRDGGFNKKL